MPFLLVDKPAGITSHDVIDKLRKITGERTIGHAGTLDPFATGLLIVAVGRDSTKELQTFVGLDKEYLADVVLGATTETLDPESALVDMSQKDGRPIMVDRTMIEVATKRLTGDIKQIPPMHSAIKKGGQKLYELARKGLEVEREPRSVSVMSFELTSPIEASLALPTTLQFRIHCSSGTYVRALARDLGTELGTGGYLAALQRTKIGPFSLDQAVRLAALTKENWIDFAQNDMLPSVT